MTEKIPVSVTAKFRAEGGLVPFSVHWSDGRVFLVERVEKIERAPARVDALLPLRYTCRIGGQQKYLYFEAEKLRWFVERGDRRT